MIRARAWLSVLFLVVGVVECAAGQSRATAADLVGEIIDQTGGVLTDVAITATNIDTNAIRTARSDAEGRFVLPALPPGSYIVRANKPGFTERVVERIVLTHVVRFGPELRAFGRVAICSPRHAFALTLAAFA